MITSNAFAFSLIYGMCTALDTLCSSAYASTRPTQTILYALRMGVILTAFLVPQIVFFWNSETVFLWLYQDPRVAEKAGEYLKILSFGLPG